MWSDWGLYPETLQGIGSGGGFCNPVALVETEALCLGTSSNFSNFNVQPGPFVQHRFHPLSQWPGSLGLFSHKQEG